MSDNQNYDMEGVKKLILDRVSESGSFTKFAELAEVHPMRVHHSIYRDKTICTAILNYLGLKKQIIYVKK